MWLCVFVVSQFGLCLHGFNFLLWCFGGCSTRLVCLVVCWILCHLKPPPVWSCWWFQDWETNRFPPWWCHSNITCFEGGFTHFLLPNVFVSWKNLRIFITDPSWSPKHRRGQKCACFFGDYRWLVYTVYVDSFENTSNLQQRRMNIYTMV